VKQERGAGGGERVGKIVVTKQSLGGKRGMSRGSLGVSWGEPKGGRQSDSIKAGTAATTSKGVEE